MPARNAGEQPSANLARYIFDKRSIVAGGVNHRAFLPPPDLQLSTFKVDGLADQEIWAIGDTVQQERQLPLYGRADLQAKSVYEISLRPIRDEPPPRHVVIVDWPADKAHCKNLAQRLAKASTYVSR